MTDKQSRPQPLADTQLGMASGGGDLDNGRLICEIGVAVAKPAGNGILFFDEAEAVRPPRTKAVFEPNDEK